MALLALSKHGCALTQLTCQLPMDALPLFLAWVPVWSLVASLKCSPIHFQRPVSLAWP